jgi:hypothetical protein
MEDGAAGLLAEMSQDTAPVGGQEWQSQPTSQAPEFVGANVDPGLQMPQGT